RLEELLEKRTFAAELLLAGATVVEVGVEVEAELVPELHDLAKTRRDLGLERVVVRAVQLHEVCRARSLVRLDARERDRSVHREVEIVSPEDRPGGGGRVVGEVREGV